jgi:hypothetical protein
MDSFFEDQSVIAEHRHSPDPLKHLRNTRIPSPPIMKDGDSSRWVTQEDVDYMVTTIISLSRGSV